MAWSQRPPTRLSLGARSLSGANTRVETHPRDFPASVKTNADLGHGSCPGPTVPTSVTRSATVYVTLLDPVAINVCSSCYVRSSNPLIFYVTSVLMCLTIAVINCLRAERCALVSRLCFKNPAEFAKCSESVLYLTPCSCKVRLLQRHSAVPERPKDKNPLASLRCRTIRGV